MSDVQPLVQDGAEVPNPAEEARRRAIAHREMEISLIGDRDPAAVQAELIRDVRRQVANAGNDLWRRPAEGEWSAGEIVAHLLDVEIFMSARYRMILAHDSPPLIGFDPDLVAERLHPAPEDVEPLLELLEGLRRSNLELWNRATAEDRQRVGVHGERGPETLDQAFRMAAGHDVAHCAQMRAALEKH